jgi:hypothetical protein
VCTECAFPKMRLVLHYRGPLRSNGDAMHKQQIRAALSAQLAKVWEQPPLSEDKRLLNQPKSLASYSFIREVAGLEFVPLVTAEAHIVAELRIVLLRPGPPGDLLSQGGDIDNRLKTLFDALTVPQANQIRQASSTPPGRTFCLLEDDRLVTHVEVRAEQLLEDVDPSIVDMTVSVRTRVTRLTMNNQIWA